MDNTWWLIYLTLHYKHKLHLCHHHLKTPLAIYSYNEVALECPFLEIM